MRAVNPREYQYGGENKFSTSIADIPQKNNPNKRELSVICEKFQRSSVVIFYV